MKKLLILIPFGFFACQQNPETATAETSEIQTQPTAQLSENQNEMKTLHDYSSQTLDGENFEFSKLKGKRVLIVNTASECGYTPQYKQLQELQDEFGGADFTVIGFPSNDFGGQEPGDAKEIAAFCEKNYGVTFPLMAKSPVKGEDKNPVYKWLTSKEMNGKEDAEVKWNFNKFLVDENGKWVAYFPSGTSPLDEEIVEFAKGK